MRFFLLDADITNQLSNFFKSISSENDFQWIFLTMFDTWYQAFFTIIDILASTFFIYYILRLFKESRAWQLFKGFLAIIFVTLFCSSLGLTTISYILSNSISILVIGFVVIFQPELRKALETFGRSSFKFIHNAANELNISSNKLIYDRFIETLVIACERMAKTKTGALIVIERTTGLREIIDNSSTAVIMDANMSVDALEQIFYKNTPLHDGALILRNHKIYAARCHVPLSDTVRLDGSYGTRHRAALGITEIGDSIAIVVSEEKGLISCALGGKLKTMKNANELRDFLNDIYFDEIGGDNEKIWQKLKKKLSFTELSAAEREAYLMSSVSLNKNFSYKNLFSKFILPLVSLILSMTLFIFVQVTTNPVETYTFTSLPISRENSLHFEQAGYKINMESGYANITIRGRRSTINRLKDDVDNLIVYVELPETSLNIGNFSLPLQFRSPLVSANTYQVQYLSPANILVNISRTSDEEWSILPGLRQNNTKLVETKN